MSDFKNKENAIAIIGVAIKFPDASDLNQFWQNQLDGHVAVKSIDSQTLAKNNVDPEISSSADYVAKKATLDKVFQFDPKFFNYSSKEAELTDPSQRHFLQLCRQVFDDAGYATESIDVPVGVFGGVVESTYMYAHLAPNRQMLEKLGITKAKIACDKDFLTTRVSYKLDLKGPSMAVQTACSTGLVAVHIACQSLLSEEVDMALAGAASISFPHEIGYLHRENSIYSKSGICRPFDVDADGTVFGDGVGVVLLKRYDDAVADKDDILAVIEGTAVNNDGADKGGYTAPSAKGQFDVIAAALANAELEPKDLDFIETHGTGTALGDAVEISALKQLFAESVDEMTKPCYIGSAKGGLGHLNTCAGMAGLIRAALALKHRRYPATVNFKQANPLLEMTGSGLEINKETVALSADTEQTIYAGVSSFGIGGSNAHVILSSAPKREGHPQFSRYKVMALPLSAKSPRSLELMREQLTEFLTHTDYSLNDIAFTLRTGRSIYAHRAVVLVAENQQYVINDKTAIAELSSLPQNLVDQAYAWCLGSDISWSALQPLGDAKRVRIPGYAFDCDDYLIPLVPMASATVFTAEQPKSQSTEISQIILEGYREVLGNDAFELDDDFIESGGDSMAAIDLMEYLEGKLEQKPMFDQLMKYTSATALAKVLAPEQANVDGAQSVDSVNSAVIEQREQIQQDMSLGLCSTVAARADTPSNDSSIDTILLSGVTGFLGSWVLCELLKTTEVKVVCLVRADTQLLAEDRVFTMLHGRRIDDSKALARVSVILADLGQEQLGLSKKHQEFIRQEVDSIIHIGAHVNWVNPYERLRNTNVLSTVALADLALGGKCRYFNYVSSVAVFDGPNYPYSLNYKENCQMRGVETLYTGYAQTKAVCETILSDYRQNGLDVRVFRPAYIMGHSEHGSYNPKDFIYLVLDCFVKLGCMPDVNYRVNLTPVDYVAAQMCRLSLSPQAANQTIHTLSSDAIYFEQIIEATKASGLALEVVSGEQFYEAVQRGANNRELDGILPFVEFFKPLSDYSFKTTADGHYGAGNNYNNENLQRLMQGEYTHLPDIQAYLTHCINEYLAKTAINKESYD